MNLIIRLDCYGGLDVSCNEKMLKIVARTTWRPRASYWLLTTSISLSLATKRRQVSSSDPERGHKTKKSSHLVYQLAARAAAAADELQQICLITSKPSSQTSTCNLFLVQALPIIIIIIISIRSDQIYTSKSYASRVDQSSEWASEWWEQELSEIVFDEFLRVQDD